LIAQRADNRGTIGGFFAEDHMAKRLSMRKIAEVLRLHHECSSSQRDIALAVGVSPTTVCPTALTVRDKPEVATVFASTC